jgi:carboxyl-terminal processing protease
MSARARLVLALVSTALIGYIAVGSLLGRVLGDTSYGQLAVFNEVVRLVLDAYVEPVNIDRAMAGARQGMSDALDGDSAYLDPDEFRSCQQPPKEGEAETGLVLTRRFAFVMVVAARPGSPADAAGLRPGDLVKSIDDRHTRTTPAVVAERLLRGAPGSSVKLGILRAGADPLDVSIVRERLQPAVAQGRMLEGSIGYVQIADFTPTAAEEVRTQVAALARGGASRFVLDLRSAAFGSPDEAVKVAEIFMAGGTVAKLVARRAQEQTLQADPARSAWSGPLAALVDNGTAGPGEIVAAALADSGRATLVGERTFGRAFVSRAVPLPEGGLLITVAKYVSPKGTVIHGEGLKPTVAAEGRAEEDEDLPPGTPKPDRILDKAIETLKSGAPKPAA